MVNAGHYTWHPPKAKHGDRVFAQGHRGGPREGKVGAVETHYDDNGAASHSYHVRFDLNKVRQWLGDDGILRVIGSDK